MSMVSLEIPKSLYHQAEELAAKEGVSLNEFVKMALVEKVATMETADYLAERAKRGSREKLLAVLAKAPDVDPEGRDRL
jgi:hypothetical protein